MRTSQLKIAQNMSLVPLNRYRSLLLNELKGLPGALNRVYLDSRALRNLDVSARFLKDKFTDFTYELLILDAYRTRDTQAAIYAARVADVAQKESTGFDGAYSKATDSPDGIFPHGTGGAVDVTLLINGMPAEMGTVYDEITPQSRRHYFRDNPPKSEKEKQAHENREILRSAMEHAGFVGLDSEWWHYEWGTRLWSEITSEPIVLTTIYPNPQTGGRTPAYIGEEFSLVQPIWFGGIAQVFENPYDRASALARKTNDYYYARVSHPSVYGLSNYIKEYVVEAQFASLVASGLSACRTALIASVPTGGVLLCDIKTYFEVGNEIFRLSGELGWTVEYVDFGDSALVRDTCVKLSAAGKTPDVFYFDSPTNWWLGCSDLKSIKEIANDYGCKTIVDISVQPLQTKALQYSDIVVISLSKYPSLGLTLGGVILTNDVINHTNVEALISRTGDRLSGDTAATIWCQIVSLRDRMESLDAKIIRIKEEVSSLSAISEIRVVDRLACSNLIGGVFTLDLKNGGIGSRVERIVGYNSNRKKAALHLAYTFGCAMTTLEHFASNPRKISAGNPNLSSIPETFLRISVGCEPVEHIISDLKVVLSTAAQTSKDIY